MRIVKYRGTAHGTNEYPFLIDEDGFSVLPVTSLGLHHEVSDERISSGVPRLDRMLGGQGFYRGTTILVSGTAGTGKTSLAAHLRRCRLPARRALPLFFLRRIPRPDYPQHAIHRPEPGAWSQKKLLQFHSSRATFYGLEMHLAMIHKIVRDFQPQVVVIDPVGSLIQAGNKKMPTPC